MSYLVAISCLLFLLSCVAMAQLFCAVQSSCTLTFALEYAIPSLHVPHVCGTNEGVINK